ncbi:hypothetical protein HUJ05_000052 [Dendroctonus ponderosae]|nr:hypothetical protein HUJ05_000052 [Dendroctonus ponderosae]
METTASNAEFSNGLYGFERAPFYGVLSTERKMSTDFLRYLPKTVELIYRNPIFGPGNAGSDLFVIVALTKSFCSLVASSSGKGICALAIMESNVMITNYDEYEEIHVGYVSV